MHTKVPNKAAIADAREIGFFILVATFHGRFRPLCPAKAHEAWECSAKGLGVFSGPSQGPRKNYFYRCCKRVLAG